jgi:hypothetical protein
MTTAPKAETLSRKESFLFFVPICHFRQASFPPIRKTKKVTPFYKKAHAKNFSQTLKKDLLHCEKVFWPLGLI